MLNVPVLEVGGTHVTAASVTVDDWTVRASHTLELDPRASADTFVATVASAAMSISGLTPAAWVVAMPDPFDYDAGIALFHGVGKFDALYGLDVRAALGAAIVPRPTSLAFVHDCEAFLLGEWHRGSARGARRAVAITLGSGVGSAFLVDGQIVRDAPGLPPDGRIHRVEIDGKPLEDTVSRRAIRAAYAAAGGDAGADVHDIADRARTGDPVAGPVLAGTFGALGRALAPILTAFEPEVVVIGGSIARSWDLVAPPIVDGLSGQGVVGVDLRPAQHPVEAPLIGAASRVLAPTSEALP